jgi:hypothetical protein
MNDWRKANASSELPEHHIRDDISAVISRPKSNWLLYIIYLVVTLGPASIGTIFPDLEKRVAGAPAVVPLATHTACKHHPATPGCYSTYTKPYFHLEC